jgi:hypothetical protein
MFNPFSAVTTARELEKLLQSGHKEDSDARDALLNILKSSGYTSVTPELREVLAFSIGYFSKCFGQGGVVEEMASTYSALCANIANGHVSI